MKNNIQGLGVALVTPFSASGEVDFNALGRIVSHVAKGGADYLVALGTTAETPTLNADEKREVLACIKRNNVGSLPIVLGIGGNNTAEVVKSLMHYDLNGVEAILSVTPYYNRPSQDGLFQHYRCLAIESPLPLILYNVPARTGVNMAAATTLRLAHEHDNIIGVKEACGSLNQMAYILRDRPKGFRVISGDDSMALPLAAMGGDGVISVAANAFAVEIKDILSSVSKGDMLHASASHLRILEIVDSLFEEGNPAGIKTVLSLKGLCDDVVRLPLVPGSHGLHEKIAQLMEQYDL